MKILYFIAFLFATMEVSAKDEPKYPVSAIPEELRQNANVVIRHHEETFKILSRSKATHFCHVVYTILNAKGKSYAEEIVAYDKLRKITSFKATAYDASGMPTKKLKNSEIIDQSSFEGLYSDNRLKAADLIQGQYPYSVEFEYEVEYKFLYFIPDFDILPDEKVSSQHAAYTLSYPKTLRPRYYAINVDLKPSQSELDGEEFVRWEFNNMKAVKFEPLSPPESELLPQIIAAPSSFEFDGYAGNMDTWDGLGQWIKTLNVGRDILPDATKEKIRNLTASCKTTDEKVRVVYEFLQNKTRYVSIQLGIGGFQPFEAAVVDQVGYGDCKALSNYMVALLSSIGIKSNYTLIRAGDNAYPFNVGFPASRFNHVVVFVPNEKDTIWLECTSQTNPLGYMGNFTGNRNALAITDNGAKIVRTPVYGPDKNVQRRTAEVKLDMSGNASAKVKTTYSGLQYENGDLNFYITGKHDDQQKWVRQNTQIPAFDINNFMMKNIPLRIPSAEVTLDLTLNRLASVSGKRLFLVPNLMNRSSYIPDKVDARKNKVVIKTGYVDLDTINYTIPEEIYPEFLPEAVKIKSRFGEYEASFTVDQGKVIYVRRVRMINGEYPPDSYNELIDFYKSVSKADHQKIVFLNKT
jgi:transglutaminase-like putative cysteine protease